MNSSYQIIEGDAFEWLAARKPNSVQAVLTDPPYGLVEYSPEQLAKRKNGKGIWRLPQQFDGHIRQPIPRFTVLTKSDHERIEAFHHRLAVLLLKVLVPGGHVIIASQNLLSHHVSLAFEEAGFEIRGQIARVVRTLRGGDRPKGAHKVYKEVSVNPRGCWEPWLIFRKPCDGLVRDNLRKWHTGALRRPTENLPFFDLIYSSPARTKERAIAPHPSLKPQAFMRQLVRTALPLGRGVVLDPFMGAGSTIAAAEFCGYRSIGLEVNSEYFRMAKLAIPKLRKLPFETTLSSAELLDGSVARKRDRTD